MRNPLQSNYDRLLEAALVEFGENGYEKASTAAICEHSGVSKGLLFFHFKSKSGLFFHILRGILDAMMQALPEPGTHNGSTFYETILTYERAKLAYVMERPREYLFLCEAFFNTPRRLSAEITALYNDLARVYWDVFTGLEAADGIDKKKVIELIAIVSRSLTQKYAHALLKEPDGMLRIDALLDEANEYFHILLLGVDKKS
ncbi:MAG: TetR/AcrR family transcriptional regulator [Clostridiales bacterium]|jgi:AcrR family transcriptional regulator|nr:TetR/AcrR family transcriptional regulator [Clostridiales bacterium]